MTWVDYVDSDDLWRFNTASGMRSHVTGLVSSAKVKDDVLFQYRKRYEITCDQTLVVVSTVFGSSFNTASGMRSHVTAEMSLVVAMAL